MKIPEGSLRGDVKSHRYVGTPELNTPGFLFGRLLLPKHKSSPRLVRGSKDRTSGFSEEYVC